MVKSTSVPTGKKPKGGIIKPPRPSPIGKRTTREMKPGKAGKYETR